MCVLNICAEVIYTKLYVLMLILLGGQLGHNWT